MRRVKQNGNAKSRRIVRRIPKADYAQKDHVRGVKQITCVMKNGGSEWVSNPPWTLEVPINGFEVREAHRSLLAPS